MNIKKFQIILIIILIFIAVYAFININQMAHNDGDAAENSDKLTREIIVNNTTEKLGSVEVIRNIGNPNAEKIAYVVGVHPLENDTHKTFLKILPTLDNLNYCYDVYIINVSLNFSDYGELLPDDQPGREEGQELAYKYVYPKIAGENYKLAVDVHAHGGAYGEFNTFVFCPLDGGLGEKLGRNVSQNTQNITYYNPQFTTSGPYLTVPLNEKGIPAFYFEENSFIPQNIKDAHMLELINAVDQLKF